MALGQYASAGNVDKVLEIFQKMETQGMAPTYHSYVALINVYGETKQTDSMSFINNYNA